MLLSKKRSTQQAGFTFVEVMIAMGVVVVVIMSIMAATTIIGQNSQVAYERSVAVQEANRIIEQIRNIAQTGTFPNDIVAQWAFGTILTNANGVDATLNNGRVLIQYEDLINPGNGFLDEDPLSVIVTVNWNENGVRDNGDVNVVVNGGVQVRTLVTQRI